MKEITALSAAILLVCVGYVVYDPPKLRGSMQFQNEQRGSGLQRQGATGTKRNTRRRR